MGIIENLFSRRIKKEKGEFDHDVYEYEVIPNKLRDQLFLILGNGDDDNYKHEIYIKIFRTLAEEHGIRDDSQKILRRKGRFQGGPERYPRKELINFFFNQELDIMLDFIQLFLKQKRLVNDDIITEVNQRMLENGFGYQFEDGLIVKINSKHIHKEMIVPTLNLLQDKQFKNVNDSYRAAFDSFNSNDLLQVYNYCSKAIESMIKDICIILKYSYKKEDTMNKLVKHLEDNKFFAETHLTENLNHLCSLLKNVSKIRNKQGAVHGESSQNDIEISKSTVYFVLGQTATIIRFLFERYQELKK